MHSKRESGLDKCISIALRSHLQWKPVIAGNSSAFAGEGQHFCDRKSLTMLWRVSACKQVASEKSTRLCSSLLGIRSASSENEGRTWASVTRQRITLVCGDGIEYTFKVFNASQETTNQNMDDGENNEMCAAPVDNAKDSPPEISRVHVARASGSMCVLDGYWYT